MTVTLRDTIKLLALASMYEKEVHNPPYKIIASKKLKTALKLHFYELTFEIGDKPVKQMCVSENGNLQAGQMVKWIPLPNDWWHVVKVD